MAQPNSRTLAFFAEKRNLVYFRNKKVVSAMFLILSPFICIPWFSKVRSEPLFLGLIGWPFPRYGLPHWLVSTCVRTSLENSSMYYFFRSDSTDNKSCPSLCNYDQHIWIFQVFLPPVQHGEHSFRNNFWPNITVCKVSTASANKCHVAYKDRTAWWR